MEIRPIRTHADYNAAMAEITRLADAEPGTSDFDRLDVLVTLVEAYEAKICPIEPPDPISAIEFALDRLNLSRRDLEPYMGSSDRVDAILERRRRMTLPMIHRLSVFLNIPVTILAQDYPLQGRDRRNVATSVASPKTASVGSL